MTCWFSGTQRTRTSATFLSVAESDVSTGLSRNTDIVAPNLHAIHYISSYYMLSSRVVTLVGIQD